MHSRVKSFLFENRTLAQTVAKNTFWMAVGAILSRLVKAILIIYVARILGAESYGIFSYAVSLAAFFAIFSDVGIGAILTREIAGNPSSARYYFSTGLILRFALMAISAGLILGVAPFFAKIPEVSPLLPLAAFLIILDGIRGFAYSVTRAEENMQIEAGGEVLTNAAITVFGIIGILISASPFMLLVGYTSGVGVGMIFSIAKTRRYFLRFWKFFKKELIKPIFFEAWPFAMTGLFGALMINTDTIMLGWFRSAEEIGWYAAALRIISLLYLLPVTLSTSIFPAFARFAFKRAEEFRKVFENATKMTLLVGIPIAVGGAILAGDIILLIYGPEYSPATLSLSIIFGSILIYYPVAIMHNAIFAQKKQKMLLWSAGVGAFVNVGLNLLLIPPYGMVGSAIATIVSHVVSISVMVFVLKRIMSYKIIRGLKKIIIATVVMGIVVWQLYALDTNVILNTIAGAFIYFSTLFVLKERLLGMIRPSKLMEGIK